ncbi:hypothetical protein U1Q18_008495 [Sarracenia purpurea var. burkii]
MGWERKGLSVDSGATAEDFSQRATVLGFSTDRSKIGSCRGAGRRRGIFADRRCGDRKGRRGFGRLQVSPAKKKTVSGATPREKPATKFGEKAEGFQCLEEFLTGGSSGDRCNPNVRSVAGARRKAVETAGKEDDFGVFRCRARRRRCKTGESGISQGRRGTQILLRCGPQ